MVRQLGHTAPPYFLLNGWFSTMATASAEGGTCWSATTWARKSKTRLEKATFGTDSSVQWSW
jgi:hypothetical protein